MGAKRATKVLQIKQQKIPKSIEINKYIKYIPTSSLWNEKIAKINFGLHCQNQPV
jgi:hypothetical protein